MRVLRPGGVAIPRAFRNHRSKDGHRYRAHVCAILARLGDLPADARPTLREAGRLAVELEHLAGELETARSRRRQGEMRRVRRQQFAMREQLTRLERRLEELAAGRHGTSNPLGDVQRAVAEAAKRWV